MMMKNNRDANTLLLLHAEDFTDSSMYNRTIANNGASFAYGKFGDCFYFDGSTWINLPETIDFISDFTVDFWIKMDYYYNEFPLLLGASSDHSSWIMNFFISDNGYIQFTRYDSSDHVAYNFTNRLSTNIWYHVAFTKNGNFYQGFLNGILQHTSTSAHVFSGNGPFGSTLGMDITNPSFHFHGKIDEFRISNIARWTADFTPPTSPYTI